MNKVNPKAGALKQKTSAMIDRIGNITARNMSFMFSIALVMTLSPVFVAAEGVHEVNGGGYRDTMVESNDSCCKWEVKMPVKSRVRPVHIPQPSEKSILLADYEATRNMILSLQEKPVMVALPDFDAADREIEGLFHGPTRVKFIFSLEADENIDLAFRAENIQGPTNDVLAELDSQMDLMFRLENGL